MTVNELIDFLQNVEDKEKPVVFNDNKFPGSYASITTVQNKELCVVLHQTAWLDNKSHFIEGELEND